MEDLDLNRLRHEKRMGGWQHVNPMGGLRGGTPPMQLKADLATALAENEEEQKKKKVAISKEAEQQKKTVTDQQATRLLHRKKVEPEVKKSQLYTAKPFKEWNFQWKELRNEGNGVPPAWTGFTIGKQNKQITPNEKRDKEDESEPVHEGQHDIQETHAQPTQQVRGKDVQDKKDTLEATLKEQEDVTTSKLKKVAHEFIPRALFQSSEGKLPLRLIGGVGERGARFVQLALAKAAKEAAEKAKDGASKVWQESWDIPWKDATSSLSSVLGTGTGSIGTVDTNISNLESRPPSPRRAPEEVIASTKTEGELRWTRAKLRQERASRHPEEERDFFPPRSTSPLDNEACIIPPNITKQNRIKWMKTSLSSSGLFNPLSYYLYLFFFLLQK